MLLFLLHAATTTVLLLLFETGLHHATLAGLTLSGYTSLLSPGVTDVYHCTLPCVTFNSHNYLTSLLSSFLKTEVQRCEGYLNRATEVISTRTRMLAWGQRTPGFSSFATTSSLTMEMPSHLQYANYCQGSCPAASSLHHSHQETTATAGLINATIDLFQVNWQN